MKTCIPDLFRLSLIHFPPSFGPLRGGFRTSVPASIIFFLAVFGCAQAIEGERTASLYPMEVTPEMAAVAERVAGRGSSVERLMAIQRYLFDTNEFSFAYRRDGTYTAREAFERNEGNCVAFTTLFIALARSVGVTVRPALLHSSEAKEREGELMIVNNHVVAVRQHAGGVTLYDFAHARRNQPVGMRILDDEDLVAIYLNNYGAVDLRAGRLDQARERFEQAVAISEDCAMAFNNLAVAYRKLGAHEKALNAYALAIGGWGATPTIATNMTLLYRIESGMKSDDELWTRNEVPGNRSADELIRLGHAWMARGKVDRAIKAYRMAESADPGSSAPVVARARAELSLRRPRAALSTITRAVSLDDEDRTADHLFSYLKMQMKAREFSREVTVRPG